MTPYTKEIVELHKIHKAIENCKGGGDITPTPEPVDEGFKILKNFPLWGEIAGYVIGKEEYEVDEDSVIVEPDDLYNALIAYVEEHDSGVYPITIIYKYQEELDYNNGNYIEGFYDKTKWNSLFSVARCNIEFNDNKLMLQVQGYSVGEQGKKLTINNKDYLIFDYTGD